MFPRRLGVPVGLFLLLVLPCILLAMLKGMAGNWGGKQLVRTWTDNTGRFSAKARLITDNGSSVVLERENGRMITVPVMRLSSEDQDYLSGDSMDEAMFRLTFWKWNFSDPADLWAVLVKVTPMWVTIVIPVIIAGFGLLLHRRMNL